MKKKNKKLKTRSYTEISEMLKQQQEHICIIDKYLHPILSDLNISTDPKSYARFAMAHIFANIRNSYQDGISISQALIKSQPYYISTALPHALRTAQESLIDLAYIMSDLKNKQGNEYLRYLKFILTIENEELKRLGLDNTSAENLLKNNFPPDLELPKRTGQWTDTSRKEKIKKGLKLYKIEPPQLSDFRFDFHSNLSSAAHGNSNTIYTLIQTPEENRPKLEADLTLSVAHFEATLGSALKCYVRLYLGRSKNYAEIVKLLDN